MPPTHFCYRSCEIWGQALPHLGPVLKNFIFWKNRHIYTLLFLVSWQMVYIYEKLKLIPYILIKWKKNDKIIKVLDCHLENLGNKNQQLKILWVFNYISNIKVKRNFMKNHRTIFISLTISSYTYFVLPPCFSSLSQKISIKPINHAQRPSQIVIWIIRLSARYVCQ